MRVANRLFPAVRCPGCQKDMPGLVERSEGHLRLDLPRAGDMPVARWLDRLHRNDADVRDTDREVMRRGVVARTIINDIRWRDPRPDGVNGTRCGD